MKTNLAPKHVKRIGESYLLWFENSNRYTMVSDRIFKLLHLYLESLNTEHYASEISSNSNFSKENALDLASNFDAFLTDINTNALKKPSLDYPLQKKEHLITRYYQIGRKTIQIDFESERLVQLLHPQLSHLATESLSENTTQFLVAQGNDNLLLYKNEACITTCSTENFHFLQGQFSLELINILYDKKEQDWLATLHASTICNDKEAILLIGDSGNGKSTFAAVLMAHGFDLLADDFTPLLSEDSQLYRFPNGISIKESAFEFITPLFPNFEKLEDYSKLSKQTKVKYIPPTTSFSDSTKGFSTNKIVLIKYDKNASTTLKKSTPELVLQTLIPDSWISPIPENALLFMNWVQKLSFYELTYSDTPLAIKKFESLFKI